MIEQDFYLHQARPKESVIIASAHLMLVEWGALCGTGRVL